jgi:F0F1-type ATP synthase membrane subunit b/b'
VNRLTKKRSPSAERLATSTAREMEKLKQQAQREMETADKLARKELQQYLAKRSIELARESLCVLNEARRRHRIDKGEHW